MSALDVILLSILVLFVLYLAIVAVTEPSYTWRDCMTLEDKLNELQSRVDAIMAKIGRAIIPTIEKMANVFDGFEKWTGEDDGH